MQKITPFIWFANQAEEAARFYVSLLPGSRIGEVSRSGADTPSGPAGGVLTVEFFLQGQRFIALNGGQPFPFTEAISFMIHCQSQAEVDELWARLTADGGEPGQCGWLKDKYGVSWQVVPDELFGLLSDPDPQRAMRATQAMLAQHKIDLEAIRRAANGT